MWKIIETYGSGDLHSYTVYQETGNSAPNVTKAVVYIHGGAWRDPEHTSEDGNELLGALCTTPLANEWQFISLNYRLSPEVKHPEHLKDVLEGLNSLKKRGIEEVMLVGHSAGAFMVLQLLVALGSAENRILPNATLDVKITKAVLLEGIYDLRSLVEEYADYADFVKLAFGDDKEQWDVASPASRIHTIPNFLETELFVIQSFSDELLSFGQVEVLLRKLNADRVKYHLTGVDIGKHDEAYGSEFLQKMVADLLY